MTDVNPVTAFRNLTPDQLFEAIESCKLDSGYPCCDGRILALNSYENRVYRIGIENAEPLVAKFYRPERWSDEQIIEEHEFTAELRDLEIPVIAPLQDRNQHTLHRFGVFRFSLYPCRGGRALELDNSEHLRQMGRFVGRIHAAGSTRPFRHRRGFAIPDFLVKPKEFLLENDFVPHHVREAYDTLTTDLESRVSTCFERAGTVSEIRLHGDFHASNVLWTESGPHIVDFDDCRTGPAVQDLWMFLSGERDYMTARLQELLEGYTRFYPFNPAELHLVEALRTMRIVHHAGWMASRWEDPAFPLAFPWFNTMEFWERHILDLREQAALMDEAPLELVL